MQDFLDYLGSLIMVPVLSAIVLVIINFVVKAPLLFKAVVVISTFVLLAYLIPYILRAFTWSILPAYVMAAILQKYHLIPAASSPIGNLPSMSLILGCVLALTSVILLVFRKAWLTEDRTTGDPCVPFARSKYENKGKQYSRQGLVMGKKKNPIGFIWDEDD